MQRIDTPARARYVAADFGINLSVSGSALATNLDGAIATINGLGGGVLELPATDGEFAPTTGITLLDKVFIEGAGIGATILDLSGATAVGGALINGAGSLTELAALASAIVVDSQTIVFASAPACVVGDVLAIYDSADSSFNTARTSYRAGEFVQVQAISGSTVTTTTKLYAGYASGSTVKVYKLTPLRGGISGMSVTFKTAAYGLQIKNGVNIRIDNLELTGSDYGQIHLNQCYDVGIASVRATDFNPVTPGLNYGLVVGNSQRVIVRGGHYLTGRHGIAVGGSDAIGCVPNREVLIDGAYVGSWGTTVNGANFHGNVEDCHWRNCILPSGVTLAGDRVSVKNSSLRTGPLGLAVLSAEMLGWNYEVSDNEITVTSDHESDTAFVRLQSTSTLTRTGGICRVNRNTLPMKSYGAVSGTIRGIYVYNNGGNVSNDVEAVGNILRSNRTSPASAYGIYLRGGFRSMTLTDTDAYGIGVAAQPTGAEVVEVSRNKSIKSIYRGVHVFHATTASALYIMRGNTVYRAQHNGIETNGDASGSTVVVDDNTSLENGQDGTLTPSSSVVITSFLTALYRGNVVGDAQGTPTQTRIDTVSTVGTLVEQDNTTVGTVTTRTRTSVTSRIFRGRGAGAPGFEAAVGSEYERSDGGASTTKYINEAGTSTWRAV